MTLPIFVAFNLITCAISNLINTALGRAQINKINSEQEKENQKLAKYQTETIIAITQTQQKTQLKLAYLQQANQNTSPNNSHEPNSQTTPASSPYQKEIPEYITEVELAIANQQIDYQIWKIEQEKQLTIQLRQLEFQYQQALKKIDHEDLLARLEKQIKQQNTMIWLTTRQILKNPNQPLTILLCPINNQPNGFPNIQIDLEAKITETANYYSQQGRPVTCISGNWSESNKYGQAAALSIHSFCNIPIMILEPQITDDSFYFHAHIWERNWLEYNTTCIINQFPILELQFDLVKFEIYNWISRRSQNDPNPQEIDMLYGAKLPLLQENKKILDREQLAHQKNIDINRIDRPYKITQPEIKKAAEILVRIQQLYTALMIDEYYLLYAPTPQPLSGIASTLLTSILPLLPNFLHQQIVNRIRDFYHSLYNQLENDHAKIFIPKLSLDVVESLLKINHHKIASKELAYSLKSFLKLRGITDYPSDQLLKTFESVITIYDQDYVKQVNTCLKSMNNPKQFDLALACYNRGLNRYHTKYYELALTDFDMAIEISPKLKEAYYSRGLTYYEIECYEDGINDFTQAIKLDPNFKEAYFYRGEAYSFLTEYNLAVQDYQKSFDLGYQEALSKLDLTKTLVAQIEQGILKPVTPAKKKRPSEKYAEEAERKKKRETGLIYTYDLVLVNPDGTEKSRETREQEIALRVQLNDITYIDMIHIPGDPDIKPFLIGKYPVTQKQYVALIGSNPSVFKGEDLPVEQVSFNDAINYCNKLNELVKNQKITYHGKSITFKLPTAPEWELACRAGTKTPFHFGETITTELANYNGNESYGSGPKGESRQKTTPVGSFKVANAFGLYDMHGNVWEWSDTIYKNNKSSRILSGGTWYTHPSTCTSSYRNSQIVTFSDSDVSFRLAILID